MGPAETDFTNRLQSLMAAKPSAPSEGSSVESEMLRADPDAGTPLSIRNLFTHHDAHPVVLDLALLRAYQLDWIDWEVETLWAEITRDFKSQISELTRAKIQTLRTLHLSPSPWERWEVFEKIIQGLNNNIPRWGVMQAPSLEQLFSGIDILNMVNSRTFSDEVKLYMAAAVLNEEVMYVPAPLDFIQPELAQPFFHCNDCGSEYGALFHDGTCDNCTQKFSPEQGLTMEPKRELVLAGRGKNMGLRLKYDPTEVEERWNEVKDSPSSDVDIQENAVDVQVAKLLVSRDYMNVRRRQLVEQITSLKSWLGAT